MLLENGKYRIIASNLCEICQRCWLRKRCS
nr:MAG TPA: hypothetical protein [Caudoviricetes sp.]